MEWYSVTAVICFSFCLSVSFWHLLRMIQLGRPIDFAKPAGKVEPALAYSFTGAMSPAKKESAFLHLPTYVAGLVYHGGTFMALTVLFLAFMGIHSAGLVSYGLCAIFVATFACGAGILAKRVVTPRLRGLSNPDDYISNLVVTMFHLTTAVVMILPASAPVWYLSASLLFLWFPAGKLKHAFYFFAARYQLGFFFGTRGVWPPADTFKH